MKEPQDNLQPETIDHLIDAAGLSADDHQTSSLIEYLHTSSQAYARENERSLDYIWSRLAQSQGHSVFLPAQWKQLEEKQISIKERKVMQDTNTSWGMNSFSISFTTKETSFTLARSGRKPCRCGCHYHDCKLHDLLKYSAFSTSAIR